MSDPQRYLGTITVRTKDGPQQVFAIVLPPFAVNIGGIAYGSNDAGKERDHHLLCTVTHLGTGYAVAGDLRDDEALWLARALVADPEVVAAFAFGDPEESATIPLAVIDRIHQLTRGARFGRWEDA